MNAETEKQPVKKSLALARQSMCSSVKEVDFVLSIFTQINNGLGASILIPYLHSHSKLSAHTHSLAIGSIDMVILSHGMLHQSNELMKDFRFANLARAMESSIEKAIMTTEQNVSIHRNHSTSTSNGGN